MKVLSYGKTLTGFPNTLSDLRQYSRGWKPVRSVDKKPKRSPRLCALVVTKPTVLICFERKVTYAGTSSAQTLPSRPYDALEDTQRTHPESGCGGQVIDPRADQAESVNPLPTRFLDRSLLFARLFLRGRFCVSSHAFSFRSFCLQSIYAPCRSRLRGAGCGSKRTFQNP